MVRKWWCIICRTRSTEKSSSKNDWQRIKCWFVGFQHKHRLRITFSCSRLIARPVKPEEWVDQTSLMCSLRLQTWTRTSKSSNLRYCNKKKCLSFDKMVDRLQNVHVLFVNQLFHNPSSSLSRLTASQQRLCVRLIHLMTQTCYRRRDVKTKQEVVKEIKGVCRWWPSVAAPWESGSHRIQNREATLKSSSERAATTFSLF